MIFSRLLMIVFLPLVFFACSTSEIILPKTPIICGILTFEPRAGVNSGEAESIAEMFASALQNSKRFTVIERKQLIAVMQEQGFQAAQNPDAAAEAGKILSIRKMFSGSIGMLGGSYVLILKMIDVESSQIDLAVSRTYNGGIEDINEKFLPDMVKEIMRIIDNKQIK